MTNYQIIVVDDDLEDQVLLLEYFKDVKCDQHVKFIPNGKDAITYLEKLSRDSALPNLIVLDLNMPVLNGSQTLFQLKHNTRFKDIPVIILTTSENDNEKRKCLGFGAVDFLIKPSRYDDGLRIVERFTTYLQEASS